MPSRKQNEKALLLRLRDVLGLDRSWPDKSSLEDEANPFMSWCLPGLNPYNILLVPAP